MSDLVKITIYVTPDAKAYLQQRYGRKLAHVTRAMWEVDSEQPAGSMQLGKPGEYEQSPAQRKAASDRLIAVHKAARESEETSK